PGARMRSSSNAPKRICSVALVRNFGLDQLREQRQGLLPTEVAGIRRNDVRNTLLDDVHLGSDAHFLQSDGDFHLAGQARIVEPVRVTNSLVRLELEVAAAVGMAL